MKNNIVKVIGRMVLAFLVISTLTFWVSAQDNLKSQNGGGRLEGTWDAQVTLRVCQTGAAIRTFPTILTFMSGGTMITSESAAPQSLHTPGHGVWSHTTGNAYSFKFKAFNFDTSGNFTGWTIIKNEVYLIFPQILPHRDGYESAGTAEVYAPNGKLLFTGCSTATATRFE